MKIEQISLAAAGVYGAQYDQAVKENLHHPKLIAPILRAVVPEYKDYTCEEVVQFIVKDSITDDPVDDVSVMANQMESEMSSVSDKLIRYDSRFKAINPKLSDSTISFYLHIDIEVQNDYKPSKPKYPIIKRGIYYGAREISSQLGILTEETNYGKLEKVYSIWICNENIPKDLQNTVSSYKIIKTDEIGVSNEPDSDYDLMNVIIIRRGTNATDDEIFDYLEAYFRSDIKRIGKYIDVEDDEEIKEGVEKMTGLGESIAIKNYNQGAVNTLINLVKDGLLELKEAAKRAQMTETEFSQLLNEK